MKALIDLGVRFVRIEYGSKKPIENWKTASRTYSAESFDPAMAGFNVGVVADDRLVLIDVEGPSKTGCANGWPHLNALQLGHGRLPETLQYSTPSGGCGLIFKAPAHRVPFVDLSKSFGLEMRTGMHYSLIPHSFYDGEKDGKGYRGHYSWMIGPEMIDELPEVPGWLVDWFSAQAVKSDPSEGTNSTGHVSPDFISILLNNVWELDPDMSYPDWWKVMAICHRAGGEGFELFLQWSKTGQKYTGQETGDFINRQWQGLDRREGVKEKVGLPWLLAKVRESYPVREQEPPPHYDDHVDVEEPAAPVGVINPDLWPLLPLTGILEEMRLRLERFSPDQTEINYIVPLICAQAAFTRKFLYHPKGLQGHWYALIGPAASGKTTYKNIIKTVLAKIDQRMIMDSFESPNGLKASFAEYPRRLLIMDEGLKIFNAALANEGKSSFDAKVISLILNMHNNKGDQEETGNRIKAYRIPKVVFPQLSLVTFDQLSYWETFRTNSASLNGMVSRFALYKLKQCPLDRDYDNLTTQDLTYFARGIARLVPPDPVKFSVDEEDLASWSPVDPWGLPDFKLDDSALELFKLFEKDVMAWAFRPDVDQDLSVSVATRSLGFALLLAQIICVADGRNTVTAAHLRPALGVAYVSIQHLGAVVDPIQNQVITLVNEVLKLTGPIAISALIKRLPNRLRTGDQGWERCRQIISSHFHLIGKRVQPL